MHNFKHYILMRTSAVINSNPDRAPFLALRKSPFRLRTQLWLLEGCWTASLPCSRPWAETHGHSLLCVMHMQADKADRTHVACMSRIPSRRQKHWPLCWVVKLQKAVIQVTGGYRPAALNVLNNNVSANLATIAIQWQPMKAQV